MSFLTAGWRKLIFANYPIDPAVLHPYLPYGTELDEWNGNYYVSLIGFMFTDVRLRGIAVPFHTRFEEVNLRFYVRRKEADGWRRGVVFIREIVPLPALVVVANTVYGENYIARRMRHHWAENDQQRSISYAWKQGGRWHSLGVEAALEGVPIAAGSEEEFITEHYWGYAHVNDRRTNEYEVTHPRWDHYPVHNYQIDVDFATCYGERFSFLDTSTPTSVLLAEGSAITIEGKRLLSAS